MKRFVIMLMLLLAVSASAQSRVRIVVQEGCEYAADQLRLFLEKGGGIMSSQRNSHIFVGNTPYLRQHYRSEIDSLHDDGYLICSDGKDLCLYGAGEKGTLYAVYAFLELQGYRLYTPDALVVPDASRMLLPKCHIVSNPAFRYREVAYYYPNHSQLYADWHRLHTQADRDGMFGMFVHTFGKILPPAKYFDVHPEWYSMNNGRRSRDGQLCLSNPDVLETLCQRLADTMARYPEARIWSVSPNDNYNVCECSNCRHLDSVCGGQSGTLLWFVNQVARRFPDKTISTLAYQYTRKAPANQIIPIKPDPNVLVMLCPIEAGRQAPITQTDPAFRKDMEDWSRLCANDENRNSKFENHNSKLFVWDYVVQFRNFWNPFPNLHVLQPNLQYFRDNGVRMVFEQATGANNVTSWMDIRCYMLAKLLWNPDADMDSIMSDFYKGYYGDAGRYVKEIIDTMTTALVQSGQMLNIYGYPVDGCFANGDVQGYLWPTRMEQYYDWMKHAYAACSDTVLHERLRFFELALDFASIELKANDMYGDFEADEMLAMVDRLTVGLCRFGVPEMMEMGITPEQYGFQMRRWTEKTFSRALAWKKPVTLRKPATAPYNTAGLTDGEAGIMDYRHRWLGFWGDTLDAVIDLGEPTEVHKVSLDFYFYPLSWIFRPQRIEVYLSDDSVHWNRVGEERPGSPEVLATPHIYNYTNQFPTPTTARYVRVVAEPLPEIPFWHRAAGQKAWIFTDEIVIF